MRAQGGVIPTAEEIAAKKAAERERREEEGARQVGFGALCCPGGHEKRPCRQQALAWSFAQGLRRSK